MVDENGKLAPAVIALEQGRRAVAIDDVVVKAVCKKCNNGWMSRLERDAEPLLRALQVDRDVTLSEAEVQVLVRWSQKTALMVDRWAPEPRAFPDDVFRAVYQGDTPPGIWHIRLARAAGECRSHFSHSLYTQSWFEPDPESGRYRAGSLPKTFRRPLGVQFHVAVGRLAIMVRFIQHRLGPGISIDGDFLGLGSRSPVLLGDGAVRTFRPQRWPTYDLDAWADWDLWTPFPGPGTTMLVDDEDGNPTVVLVTPPVRPKRPRQRWFAWFRKRVSNPPAIQPPAGWTSLSDSEPWRDPQREADNE